MDDKYKEKIRENYAELVKRIEPEQLIPYLKCLTDWDRDKIIQDGRYNGGRHIAAMTLLDILPRRDEWFQQFMDALCKTGHNELIHKLEPDGQAQNVLAQEDENKQRPKRNGTKKAAEPITENTLLSTLSYKVTKCLKQKLDINMGCQGGDWKSLAAELDLSLEEVQSLAQEDSPTESLLARWTQRSPDTATLGKLCEFLEKMGRKDVIDEICKITNYKPILRETGSPVRDTRQLVSQDSQVPGSFTPTVDGSGSLLDNSPTTEMNNGQVTREPSALPVQGLISEETLYQRSDVSRIKPEILNKEAKTGSKGPAAASLEQSTSECNDPTTANADPGDKLKPQSMHERERNSIQTRDEDSAPHVIQQDSKVTFQIVEEENPYHSGQSPTANDQENSPKSSCPSTEEMNSQPGVDDLSPSQTTEVANSHSASLPAEGRSGHSSLQDPDKVNGESVPHQNQEQNSSCSQKESNSLPQEQHNGESKASTKKLPFSTQEVGLTSMSSIQKPLPLSQEESKMQSGMVQSAKNLHQNNHLSPDLVAGRNLDLNTSVGSSEGDNSCISRDSEKSDSELHSLAIHSLKGGVWEQSTDDDRLPSLEHALNLKSPDARLVRNLEEGGEDLSNEGDGATNTTDHYITSLKGHQQDRDIESTVPKMLFRPPSDDTPVSTPQATLDSEKLTLPTSSSITLSPVPEQPSSPSYKSKCPSPLNLVQENITENNPGGDQVCSSDGSRTESPGHGQALVGTPSDSPGLRMRRNSLRGGNLPDLPRLEITPRQPHEFDWNRPVGNQGRNVDERPASNILSQAAPFMLFGILATIGIYKNLS